METTAQDRVLQAADTLYEQTGARPTLAEVRSYLGGGSMTTISEAMKLWRKKMDARPAEVNTVAVPELLEKEGGALLASFWQTASTLANERLAKEREALASAQLEYEAQLSEAEEIIAILEQEKKEEQQRNALLSEKLEQSVAALKVQQSENHDKDVKIASLSSANDALREKNEELTALHQKYEVQVSEHQKTDKAANQVKTDLAVALAEKDLLKSQLDALNNLLSAELRKGDHSKNRSKVSK